MNCIYRYLNRGQHVGNRHKEKSDKHVIYSALKKITARKAEDLKTHLVFAGEYYYDHEDRLGPIILNGMKKYKIKSVMITNLFMERHHLITKETMEDYCKGNYDEKDSVIDDLESFFEDIRLGKHRDEPEIWTYFLPKAGFQIDDLRSEYNWPYSIAYTSRSGNLFDRERHPSSTISKALFS